MFFRGGVAPEVQIHHASAASLALAGLHCDLTTLPNTPGKLVSL